MPWKPVKDPWFFWYFGRDHLRRHGWIASLAIAPAESLMRGDELYRATLVGLDIVFHFRCPLGEREPWRGRRVMWGDVVIRPDERWRFPIAITFHSDAAEIATRRAGLGAALP